ncbi:response regulator [Duganella sp. BJB488]|uniref:PAS domain-containing hybrid sensor histidine kinase/response regulator n=1 Tax=unclassified Duganella TaxID=2636909 RepID=UPI000E3525E5|nr:MULTISPECIES: response regulator [unclassified Duganella]RFP10976.1 response regulator [Duganella sp. BJB489]RFP14475.1 response regulator [Duganella sp. BJB488]RFP30411.1 response regulator [Duganella sp. BJB480]
MPHPLNPDQLSNIIDIAENAILCTDERQRIILFNRGAERMFGWAASEVVGKSLELLIPQRFRSGHAARVSGFRHGDTTARRMGERSTIYAVRKDGTEFPAEATISKSGEDGQVILTAILQDISERKAYEQELEQAKETAEAAVRAKSMFLANMSHEIRTPLNAVIGMTSLLLHTGIDEEQRDYTETIRSSSEALLAVINDLLDYSKMEVGRLDLERHAVEIRRCVEDALDLVASSAGEKHLDLAYIIEPGVPATMLSDATRLRQILVNLLSNAIKFTHHGEVVVTVGAERRDANTYSLDFAVRDTGIGIPEHSQESIFRSFTQVDASTTRRYGGTGLGLTISRRLAEIMGGSLTVHSEMGKGSTFTLSMLAEASDDQLAEDVLRDRSATVEGKRILIVDDNTTNRRILMRQALLWGMEGLSAASAAEAIDLVRHGAPFDVAVLDMQMPDMDGVRLAAELRKIRDRATLPLVLLTSVGHRQAGSSLDGGMFAAWLNKPIKPRALLDALRQVLSKREPTVAAPRPAAVAPGLAAAVDILVVEDNTINQKVLRQLLRHLGYQADVVANGVEAMTALEGRHYQIILMDMQMPEMDGFELTRRLRQRFKGSNSPYIIAMTANALPGDRERCLDAGMDEYIAKPIELHVLNSALVAAIARLATRRPDDAVLSHARIAQLRAIGEDLSLLDEVVASFIAEVPQLLEKLASAATAQDAPLLASTAHYLQSSIEFVGANRMRLPCTNLELMGKGENFDDAAEQLQDLALAYEDTRKALLELNPAAD